MSVRIGTPVPSVDAQRRRAAPLPELKRAVNEIIDTRAVRSVYQPLVDLDSGEVLGYEALARGPVGSPAESPLDLFATADALGRTVELDWVCRAAAYQGALDAGLHRSLTLFVNNEPTALGSPCPADLVPVVTAAETELRIVTEMTERALSEDPAELLAAVRRARAVGWGVALDDVGAEPASLAFMPLVRPDVVKLDLRLVQGRTTSEISRIVSAVLAETEASGGTVLAEGIETAEHLAVARSLGATVGQGWLWGRPAALPASAAMCTNARSLPLLAAPQDRSSLTPFDVLGQQRTVKRTTKRLLTPLSAHLECQALEGSDSSVLLACFQDHELFTPATRNRYSKMAEHATFVAALGVGMPAEPTAGVRGASLHPQDPLRGEWTVIVIGPHFAGALAARDLGDGGLDADRRFDYVVTHNRELVIQAASTIIAKVAPRR